MQIKNLLNIKIFIILIFIIFFLIGVNSFQDFGIYTDDPWRRTNDLFWYNYVKSLFLSTNLSFADNLDKLLNENKLLLNK